MQQPDVALVRAACTCALDRVPQGTQDRRERDARKIGKRLPRSEAVEGPLEIPVSCRVRRVTTLRLFVTASDRCHWLSRLLL